MKNLFLCTLAAAAAVAACTDEFPGALTAPPAAAKPKLAALLEYPDSPDRIPGRYIVVLKEGASTSAAATRHAVRTHHEYSAVLQGFAADLAPEQVARLRTDPAVKYLAEDLVFRLAQEDALPTAVQTPATWGIDRVDQPRRPVDNAYRYTNTGAGVNVYVIDSGIRVTHNEFDGLAPDRAVNAADFTGGNGLDCNGHGTHVAATIAGTTYGVAKATRVHSVRVFGCSGKDATASTIIAAMDWVADEHVKPAVANMSLGGPFYLPINEAADNLVALGVTTVVAAGNDAADACGYSPASAPSAITVANSTFHDARSDGSNYGLCTDLYAPGQNITSAWYTSDVATHDLTGTSMASPHVAGLAALFLQRNPTATPGLVHEVLMDDATPNIVIRAISGQARLSTRWNGTLVGFGDSSSQPLQHDCPTCDYFTTNTDGYIQAWLAGSPGTDFDLQLYRWRGSNWVLAKTEATTSTNETMLHYGAAGRYRFQVRSNLGSGTYDLFVRKP